MILAHKDHVFGLGANSADDLCCAHCQYILQESVTKYICARDILKYLRILTLSSWACQPTVIKFEDVYNSYNQMTWFVNT